jgi:hypothetical protein
MLTNIMHIRTAWNDYFTGSPTVIQTTEYTLRQTFSGTGVYILNCLFRSITSTSSGGALSCTSVTYLLVESTPFFSCSTSSSNGGAIYFYNSGGQCVLDKICGFDCYSSSSGQFVYIVVNNAASSKNYINYSSISRCVNENSGSHHMMYLYRGKICCPSVNSSMNKCQYYSAISCYPFADCSLSYYSFTDNIANAYGCVWLNGGGANYEIKSCNILRNTQITLNSYGIIYTSGNLKIDDSCILENNATYIFNQASSYTITLSNCTVDSNSKYGNVVTQNTVIKSFIIALNHISTRNCHSEYDSVGTLTPILQSPSSSKKQKICYTFGKYFCQSRLSVFISLLSLFIFNFIYLDTSIDSLY